MDNIMIIHNFKKQVFPLYVGYTSCCIDAEGPDLSRPLPSPPSARIFLTLSSLPLHLCGGTRFIASAPFPFRPLPFPPLLPFSPPPSPSAHTCLPHTPHPPRPLSPAHPHIPNTPPAPA